MQGMDMPPELTVGMLGFTPLRHARGGSTPKLSDLEGRGRVRRSVPEGSSRARAKYPMVPPQMAIRMSALICRPERGVHRPAAYAHGRGTVVTADRGAEGNKAELIEFSAVQVLGLTYSYSNPSSPSPPVLGTGARGSGPPAAGRA
jgi:hypothetical protein